MAGEFSFSGIGSGIDGRAVAQTVGDRIRVPNAKYDSQISDNNEESSSLERLRQLLQRLGDTLDVLRTANGGAGVLEASSSNTDVLKVIAGAGAKQGAYGITVDQLATVAAGSFGTSFESPNAFLLSSAEAAGMVSFTIGTGDTASTFGIDVSESTSLESFINDFNSQAGGKAIASLVNLSSASPDYRITFATQSLGTEEGNLEVGTSSSALEAALGGVILNQATDAEFRVNGVSGTFVQSSNSVTEAVPGLSFDLRGAGSTTVTVQGSAGGGASQVEAFVKAFNDLARFIQSEDAVTVTQDGGERVNEYGSLARVDLDDQVLGALRSAIGGSHSQDGSVSLAGLGVVTNRDGTLSFDRAKFESTYRANPATATEAVTQLADQISGVSGVLYQYTAYGLAIDQAIGANDLDNERLSQTIDNIDRRAEAREQSVLAQFTQLESLFAKLQGNSGFIQSLLNF